MSAKVGKTMMAGEG